MPDFPIKQTSAVSSYRPVVAGQIGNLPSAYQAILYGNRNWQVPLWDAFLVPEYVTTVFGEEAARSWGLRDGDTVRILFHHAINKDVNGYQTTVTVSKDLSNPYAIFLSWTATQAFFLIDPSPPPMLKGRQPPLGPCIDVAFP